MPSIVAHNDPEYHPALCPVCHQAWSAHICFGLDEEVSGPDLPICTPYRPGLSAILDWLQVASDAIQSAKQAAEEETMP